MTMFFGLSLFLSPSSVTASRATPHQRTAIEEDPSHVSDASHPPRASKICRSERHSRRRPRPLAPLRPSPPPRPGRRQKAGSRTPAPRAPSVAATSSPSTNRRPKRAPRRARRWPRSTAPRSRRPTSAALNGYAVELSEAQAKKFAADPAVKSVVQNRTFTVDAHPAEPALLGPGPDRPEDPAAEPELHLPGQGRRGRHRVHHRHRCPDHPQRLRRPGLVRLRRHRQRQHRTGRPRPRHPRGGHRRRFRVRRRQEGEDRRRPRPRQQRLRHDRPGRRGHRLGDGATPSSRPSPT